jgi:hypothetical protein
MKINKTQMDKIVKQYKKWSSMGKKGGNCLAILMKPKDAEFEWLVIEND